MNKIWTTPDGDKISGWRHDGDTITLLTVEGEWILWSRGCYVDDDVAWLKFCKVPQLPDREE